MSAKRNSAVSLADVSKKFLSGRREVHALKKVSMEVPAGLVTGLIGPDGAGKTTLMRLVSGLLTPDDGRIAVLGLDAVDNPLGVQSAIGYMPQRFGLYEDLTVQENLDLYADLQGVTPDERPGRYGELMVMTGLGPFTSRLAGRLSGGMKQKLGLACTLVRPPRLLLLDEPTVGVDPVSRRELWSIVYRLVREEGMSVLLSTAYLDEAERCDEVVILHEGRLLGTGPPKTFSGPMEGRTFMVKVPAMRKRSLQQKLSEGMGVEDAVIQADGVRRCFD
jgi:ABC-2 type transport system ATP-binding protein